MKLRHWTTQELAYLRRHFGRHAPEPRPAHMIAVALGRSLLAIYEAGRRFRLRRQRRAPNRDPGWWQKLLIPLHARGYSDVEIGQRLRCSATAVYRARKRLGLPHNRQSEHLRKKTARAHRHTIQVMHGYQSLGALRWERRRVEAARRWWQAATPFEADVLDLLESGPLTARELATRLGRSLRPDGNMDSGLYKILRRLEAGRLIERLPRLAAGSRFQIAPGTPRRPAQARVASGDGEYQARTVREPRTHRVRTSS